MLSKSQISFIKSLHQKKYRKSSGIFIIEGIKSIAEFIDSNYKIHSIYFNPTYFSSTPQFGANIKLIEVNNAELEKISTLQTPQGILALVYIPPSVDILPHTFNNKFTLLLDNVQDPGNLGTIIRTADWFGIEQIVCSEDTVEAYNPKTVQSTMGSLARIKLYYTNLAEFISHTQIPVFGALLDGESIYKVNWGKEGLILLGNEGHGISEALLSKITAPVTIPRIGKAESLNVAISAAIFCSELGKLKFQ